MKYLVTAKLTSYPTTTVDAQSQEEAIEIAQEMDGGKFDSDNGGTWEISSATPISPNKYGLHSPEMTTTYFKLFKEEGLKMKDVSYKNDAADSLMIEGTETVVYLPNCHEENPEHEEFSHFSIDLNGTGAPMGVMYSFKEVVEFLHKNA